MINTTYVKNVIIHVSIIFISSLSNVCGQQIESLDSLLKNTVLPYYENLYVHTDRNTYQPGDTIYLRGDLFSAVLNRQMLNSRFIYVDLLDNNGIVLHREKIALDTLNSSFNGYFPLHEDLENGEYSLRAYSYFMQNLGKEYFFCKKISLSEIPFDNEFVFSDKASFHLESSNNTNYITVELSLIDKLDIDHTNISVSVVATQNSVSGEKHSNGYKPYKTQEIVEKVLSITNPIFPIELSTILSGYVETVKGERLPDTKLKIYGDNGKFYFAETDSHGYVICPVEWDYGTRFYTRAFNLERKYVYLDEMDVFLRTDDVEFIDVISPSTPYPVFVADVDDGKSWTDKKIRYIEERRMGVQHGPFISVLSTEGDVSSPILSSSSKLSSNSLSNSTYGPVDDDLMKRNIKSKRKKNIQRVINGPQVNNVEFVFNGGATRYWNYNAVVSKDKPFEFTFPTAADCRTYTVVVNGVDNEGNPVSGVWSIEN